MFYESFVVGEPELAQSLHDRTLARDTRLRDALRSIQRTGSPEYRQFLVDPMTERLRFDQVSVDQAYLLELGRLSEAEPVVVLRSRVDELRPA